MAVVACASRRSFRPRDQRCLSGWPTMTGMVRQVFSRGSAWEDRHVCRKRSALGDIIESGPEAYGLDSGVWTLTDDWSGSRGRVRRRVPSWARAEVAGRNWLLGSMSATSPGSRRRHRPGALATTTSPTLKKSQTEERALLLTEEASFQQDSTLHPTWWRIGCRPQVPVTGQ